MLLTTMNGYTIRMLFLLLLCLASGCTRPGLPGAASAASPEATAAARGILQNGGNAVDAAVCAAFVLAVTEPACSGLGGQSVILIADGGKEPVVVDGTSRAPSATPDTIRFASTLQGRRAATVPTTVSALATAWQKHGSGRISWREILRPAIAYARHGFRQGPFRRACLQSSIPGLLQDPQASALYLPSGKLPAIGARQTQPLLAATLERLAADGWRDFYTGEIASEIVRDMAAHDGWLRSRDLVEATMVPERPALRSRYRGRRVYSLPPPYGGWVVLHVLEGLGEEADAMKLVTALRNGHVLRRDHPVERTRGGHHAVGFRIRGSGEGGETTHLSVVDAEGMMVGISQSVNYYYGCKVMHPTLGFFYNDYMREFVLGDSLHPYALRAGSPPYSSMSATVVYEGARPVLMLGSPGSARIISAVVQVVRNSLQLDMSLSAAVAAPRMHIIPDSALFVEDGALGEEELQRAAAAGLRRAEAPGTTVGRALNPWFGGVHAVGRDEDAGFTAAADPRRDGAAWAGND